MSNDLNSPGSLLERWEYYWQDGQVVEYVSNKKTVRGRWSQTPGDPARLIVSIAIVGGALEFRRGPQGTPDRLAESILRFSRYFCDFRAPDLGSQIPAVLRERVTEHARRAAERVTRQWWAAGNEEGQTGLFAGTVNDVEKFQHGEWEATIRVQVFSPQTKEPLTGADMGVIVDLRRGSEQVVKAALVQAKRTQGAVAAPMKLPDLVDQLADMQKTTDESYVMVYSDERSYLFHPRAPSEGIAVEVFFEDMLICLRGDRSQLAVAQAYDRSAVIDITVATGGEV